MQRPGSLPARLSRLTTPRICEPVSKCALTPAGTRIGAIPATSGVPPTFDFAGSENVKSVTVLLPAPERFPDQAGGHSIGYTRSVIFPFHVVPMDEARGSLLHLKLAYAVCEKMCVPADANLTLTLPGTIGTYERTLITTYSRVPRRVPLGAGESLVIRSVHRQRDGRVAVAIAAPDGVPIDLFAEGPTPDWSLPLPELIGSEPGMRRFAFDLVGFPPGAHADGAPLTFTVVSPGDAIEVVTYIE